MKKAVLISIQPKWCELIASGKKTIEVRKTEPKEKEPFKVYIYQTKKKWIYKLLEKLGLYRGKVIGEFVCDKIYMRPANTIYLSNAQKDYLDLLNSACLTEPEAREYMRGQYNKDMYFWHISNLKIYDKPKELREFLYPCKQNFSKASDKCKGCRYAFKGTASGEIYCDRTVLRPFQSWGYVDETNE